MTINTTLSIHNFKQEIALPDFPTKLIDKLNRFQSSKSLEIWGKELRYLSFILDYCRDIQELILIDDLEFLPDAIGYCHNLRELSLYSNQLLKHLPDTISQCKKLKVLDIQDTGLESLPNAIGDCHNLQELCVKRSQLRDLPNAIGNCRRLTTLIIENSELENLPDTIDNCQNLQKVSLRHNKMKYLSNSISNCQNLREINLDSNQLESLPENIGNCSDLERLTFTYNKVKDLPKTLNNCEKLRFLQLDYNQFEHLPEVIPTCTNLRFLGTLGNNWKSLIDITLSLSTMPGLKVSGLPSFAISETKSPRKATTDSRSSYDIVIVNPVCRGLGDYELGRKIQELVSRLDYSVKIQMTTEKIKEKLKSRLIIVTPYSINDADDMRKFIKDNFFINRNTKVLMIDEMDAVQGRARTIERYKKSLRKISIDAVDEVKIGFSTDSVGYLSITHEEREHIQERARGELEKLFDSFNMTFEPSAYYYLSYLNSEKKIMATQLFTLNTLRELEDNPSSVNYICSLGETAKTSTIIDISNKFAYIPVEHFSKDAMKKFSKINLMIVDVQNKKIFQRELVTIGSGIIPINIIFLSTMSMPKRVWHNFIAASKAGMMTGDQSLADYLSIKQEMPFYETQTWKTPLKHNILKKATDYKGEDFKEYVTTRFVGGEFSGSDYKVVDQAKLSDELRRNFRDFGRELAKKAGNYACAQKIIELAPKKSIYSSSLNSIKKLFV